MSRAHEMMTEVEEEFEIEFDSNFFPDSLCDGETCRHSECMCWDNFRAELEFEAVNEFQRKLNEIH